MRTQSVKIIVTTKKYRVKTLLIDYCCSGYPRLRTAKMAHKRPVINFTINALLPGLLIVIYYPM